MEDEVIGVGDVAARRGPREDRERRQARRFVPWRRVDLDIRRFLGALLNRRNGVIESLRVALEREADDHVGQIFRRAGEIVFDRLFQNHRSEAHLLVVAGDGS